MEAALREQVGKFLHMCFGVTPYESYIALAEKLNALAPISGPKKTFFVNSGAECVENAVKIARSYTKRPAVICFGDAFHGRTWMTMSLTSKTNPYKAGFAPFATRSSNSLCLLLPVLIQPYLILPAVSLAHITWKTHSNAWFRRTRLRP